MLKLDILRFFIRIDKTILLAALQYFITQRYPYPSVFFNLFENMFAVTGTIGGVSCQAYLTTVYPGVSIMNMPRYRASQAVRTHDVLSENKSHHYDQLIMDIVQARAKGQPLLLLFSTIRETMEFQAHALSLGHEVSTLTGHEEASADNIDSLNIVLPSKYVQRTIGVMHLIQMATIALRLKNKSLNHASVLLNRNVTTRQNPRRVGARAMHH